VHTTQAKGAHMEHKVLICHVWLELHAKVAPEASVVRRWNGWLPGLFPVCTREKQKYTHTKERKKREKEKKIKKKKKKKKERKGKKEGKKRKESKEGKKGSVVAEAEERRRKKGRSKRSRRGEFDGCFQDLVGDTLSTPGFSDSKMQWTELAAYKKRTYRLALTCDSFWCSFVVQLLKTRNR